MNEIRNIIVTTSWDDGHPMDVKLANLLAEFGINGTFYVSPRNRERLVIGQNDLWEISRHFEIGAHTLTHNRLDILNNADLEQEIKGSKTLLEDRISKSVNMFCYPKGMFNARLRQAVIDADFIGARTTKEFCLSFPDDAWQMPTTIQAYPHSAIIRIRRALKSRNWRGMLEFTRVGYGKSWDQLACNLFNKVCTEGGVWHLWGHSWEIEELDLWGDLKFVLQAVAYRKGVHYMTNGQVLREMHVSHRPALNGVK